MLLLFVSLEFLGFIVYRGFACASGGSFTKTQADWCETNLSKCARYICNTQTTLDCTRPELSDIERRLSCKFNEECDNLSGDTKYPCMNDDDCPQGRQCRDGSCKSKSSGQNCLFDGQCHYNYQCLNRKECILENITACNDQTRCPVGTRCVARICRQKFDRNACSSNSQCTPGYKCSQNLCKLIEPRSDGVCSASSECKIGSKCRKGQCKVFSSEICTNGIRCSDMDYECIDGNCVLVNPKHACRTSSDCAADEQCHNRFCEKNSVGNFVQLTKTSSATECYSSLDCPLGKKCLRGNCKSLRQGKRCSNDYQCDKDYLCKAFQCTLLSDESRVGLTSPRRARTGENCYSTKLCPPEHKCLGNRCKPYRQGKACNSRGECNYYYTCEYGQCLLEDIEKCFNDNDCSETTNCTGGMCVALAVGLAGPSCTSSDQCPQDFKCQNGQCIAKAGSKHGSRDNDRNFSFMSLDRITEKVCETSLDCSLTERCRNGHCSRKRYLQ